MSFTDHEPMAESEHAMLRRSYSAIEQMITRIPDIDITRGKAKIPGGRCVWTKDGCRISITQSSDGGRCTGCSKEPDPDAPQAAKAEKVTA